MGVERENDDIDFKVSFPGQRYHSEDAPYNFRNSVDPRFAQSLFNFSSDESSDSDAEESRGPVELIKPSKKTKKKKKRKLEGTSRASKPETGYGVIKSVPGERSKVELPKFNIKIPFKSEVIELGPTEISEEELARLRYKQNTPFKQRHREMLKKDRKEWEDNKERIFRNRDIGCAKAAVEFYNKKHGTDYKIVETLGSYAAMFGGILYHCNFRAERECIIKSGRCPSPKLFFAELLNELDADSVKTCVILDKPDPCYRFPLGCKICPDLLWHPVNYVSNSWIPKK